MKKLTNIGNLVLIFKAGERKYNSGCICNVTASLTFILFRFILLWETFILVKNVPDTLNIINWTHQHQIALQMKLDRFGSDRESLKSGQLQTDWFFPLKTNQRWWTSSPVQNPDLYLWTQPMVIHLLHSTITKTLQRTKLTKNKNEKKTKQKRKNEKSSTRMKPVHRSEMSLASAFVFILGSIRVK